MENKFGFIEIFKVRFLLKNGDWFFVLIFSVDLLMNKKNYVFLFNGL